MAEPHYALPASADCGAKAPLWIEQPETLVVSPAQAEVRPAELMRGWMGKMHRAGKTQHTHLEVQ